MLVATKLSYMKKLLLSASLSLFSLLALNAQTKRICASQDVYLQQIASNPAFAKKQQEIEAFTQRFIQHGGSRGSEATQRGTTVYTIPVVVHVVWNTAVQNISDAQVQSQIDVLNKDYQLLNADSVKNPAVFKPLEADIKVQFCLAKQDPAGKASTGIVRVQTTKTSFSTNDAVKYTSKGGDDAWDASKYLNLWVCKIGRDVLGYAQFPGGAPATDGVVILYSSFGITSATPYNLGRTATHEVGHWLNLRHIWGDDGSKCTGSDQVDDTPNQASENYGKPAFPHVTCSNGPNGDMFMNYMDYVDDDAMHMFTLDQKDRMWAVLQAGGARASLTSSQGCSAPGGGTTCTDTYEPNNAKNNAKAIAVNTDITAFIASSTDKDFFSFTTVGGATNFTISLTSLPKNYTLKLFNAAGKQLAVSNKTGTTDESITYSNTKTATYKIQVIGATTSDFDATDCYTLKVATTAGFLKEASSFAAKPVSTVVKGGVTIYPQPASSYTNIRFGNEWKGMVSVTVVNGLGQVMNIQQVNTESGLYKLDISHLQNGMYYVKIGNSKTTVTSKIVVQH